MKYSKIFRNAVLKKVLPPSNRSIYSVAKEAGISAITINSWMAKLKDGKLEIEQDEDNPAGERPVRDKISPEGISNTVERKRDTWSVQVTE
jgi:hypothetical protein